eukprot:TRINITY_DN8882_c0_g1_i2.p1 TRINITY_DN8882_c0_g1~~TRINITY_DN8882_c0_g1_i2.p1  ORF type:complete len:187 (+),score=32.25 TRINITY_DN8882_c0_g1_i2:63-623(+)
MPPYRPPHMRNQAPLPRLQLMDRNGSILSAPTATDTVATLCSRIADEFYVFDELVSLSLDGTQLQPATQVSTLGEVTLQVHIKDPDNSQMEKYLATKGTEHFLGASIRVKTESETLNGELFCLQDGSVVLREQMDNGKSNFHWLKWSIIQTTTILGMPDPSKKDLPAVDLHTLERREQHAYKSKGW